MTPLQLIVVLAMALAGLFLGYYARKILALNQASSAEKRAEEIIVEAKKKKEEYLIQAREKALQIIEEGKKEGEERHQEVRELQKRIEKRESLFDKKLIEFEEKQQELFDKATQLEDAKESITKIKQDQLDKLEKIAALTKEEAKDVLLKNTEREIKDDLVQRMRKLEHENSDDLERKAKEIITGVIERCAVSHATEITTASVDIANDEMKGRIIGREGRNIRALEKVTGTEIIVDDTPGVVVVSAFNPLRRQLAKMALDKLILDGRIQPARIEEVVEECKKDLAREIKKVGEETVYDVGVVGVDPKLVQILGRLKYRTSYGQNVLQHSIEVAHLSALLAAELGADVAIAKKAGLLHDIGKALDFEVTGTHPEIGADLGRKFGLPEAVIKPIAEHHEDHPSTLEGIIVKVADGISGARLGARKDSYESYLQRLEDLEKVAQGFEGVDKVYAIQAGREIRVFVTPDEIDDLGAIKLAKSIAGQIETELKYPGEIKVTVIREKRVEEYAR
ncbi:MAG: ribonuclease Y [Patescibacteria group bacterium]